MFYICFLFSLGGGGKWGGRRKRKGKDFVGLTLLALIPKERESIGQLDSLNQQESKWGEKAFSPRRKVQGRGVLRLSVQKGSTESATDRCFLRSAPPR